MPNREPVSLNLDATKACSGGWGSVVGRLYYRTTTYSDIAYSNPSLKFGAHKPEFNQPATLIKRALQLETVQSGYDVSPESVIALEAFRMCFRTNHLGKRQRDANGPRLERLALIAVSHDLDDHQLFRPLTSGQNKVAGEKYGVTTARRYGLVGSPEAPVVHFYLTDDEKDLFRNELIDGVAAGPRARPVSKQPYVLLHSTEGHMLETVIGIEDIR